ncbi:transcriptional regulator [Vibrio zhanjiangensis]|uniref:Transcriptional regulator n=1 Tax=Vibrio zhanjiangensis TaxID=1046128 RepID=A0ABQ6F5H9_9VIBR|nr:winged helix-turn-helix domain-containing protein [Vibrio zhanjiangensis]GLT19805.1 transcriptional regulator [Vibrio zhanjiangensis]
MTSYYKVGNLILDESSLSILNIETKQSKRIGTHDFCVLLELCKNAGNIVSKEQLLENAWPGKIVADSSITQAISNVRTLIGDDGKKQLWLKTVSKVGYRLEDGIVTQASIEELGSELQNQTQSPLLEVSKELTDNSCKTEQQKTNVRNLPVISKENLIFVSIFLLITALSWTGITYFQTANEDGLVNTLPPVIFKDDNCVIYSYTDDIPKTLINGVQESAKSHNTKLVALMIKKNDFSLSLVKQDGSLYNKLISTRSPKSQQGLINSVLKEIDNAYY